MDDWMISPGEAAILREDRRGSGTRKIKDQIRNSLVDMKYSMVIPYGKYHRGYEKELKEDLETQLKASGWKILKFEINSDYYMMRIEVEDPGWEA